MALSGSYPLPKATGRCALTDRPFAQGEAFVAALVDQGQGKLARIDISHGAWDEGRRPEGEVFGSWRANYHPGEQPRHALLDDEQLLDLFDATPALDLSGGASQPDPKHVRFRYLLALLLVRRRVLRLAGQRSSPFGPVMLVLRKGEQGSPSPVLDPRLDDLAIADALEEFGAVLGEGGA